MCSMDRIENTTTSQLEFLRELQITVNLSGHPACVRLPDGSFSNYNLSFATTFLCNVNVKAWFESIETFSSLRISALDTEIYVTEQKIFIEENVTINGEKWDFIVEKMSFKGNEFTLWKFCHLQRGGFLLSPARNNLISKVNAFKNAVLVLSDVQLETLSLYSFGASHQIISEVLNISVGTSKNRINRIYSNLPVKTKDEVFYLLYASGLAMSFFRSVGELMSRRVNRLLNK